MNLFEAIRGRRSIRAFKPDPIPREILDKILEAAQWAPSAGNLQARDFIVVFDREIKRELTRAALYQEFIEEAPVVIVLCANEERSAWKYGERGRKLYALLDAALAGQNLMLAAHAYGLGTCWVGAFRDDDVMRILHLPNYVKPIAIIPMGYPDEIPYKTSRLPLNKIVHRERYGQAYI